MPLVLESDKRSVTISITVSEMRVLFTNKATNDGLLDFVPDSVKIVTGNAGELRVVFEVAT